MSAPHPEAVSAQKIIENLMHQRDEWKEACWKERKRLINIATLLIPKEERSLFSWVDAESAVIKMKEELDKLKENFKSYST